MTDQPPAFRPTLLFSANSAWNVVHFRTGLIEGLREAGYEVVVAAPEDGREAVLREAGFRFVPLTIDRSGMNPLADLSLFRRYLSIFADVRPAAFLGFTIKPNVYGSIAARMVGVPTINNVSGLGTMFLARGWQSWLAHRLYRFAFAKSRTVFFQNPEDRQLFVEGGTIKAEQAGLLPGSGLNLAHFAPAPMPKGSPVFLFIGRLLADKGIREFVAAAAMVRESMPDARFQILGGADPGNRTTIAEAEISKWRSAGVIELLGEQADVRPFIAAASAVVLPSYREGLPRVLLEAGAMGRPSIASDVPGCRSIIRNGENGLLFGARDARTLAEAMMEFARMTDERTRAMSEEARAVVEREFGQDRVIEAYLTALRDIVPGSGVRTR